MLYLSYNVHIVQICLQLCGKRAASSAEMCTFRDMQGLQPGRQDTSCLSPAVLLLVGQQKTKGDSIFCPVILRHVINLLLFTGYTNAPGRVNSSSLRSVTNKQNGLAV